jgi:hypothetical protein
MYTALLKRRLQLCGMGRQPAQANIQQSSSASCHKLRCPASQVPLIDSHHCESACISICFDKRYLIFHCTGSFSEHVAHAANICSAGMFSETWESLLMWVDASIRKHTLWTVSQRLCNRMVQSDMHAHVLDKPLFACHAEDCHAHQTQYDFLKLKVEMQWSATAEG